MRPQGSRNGQVRYKSGWVSPRGHSDPKRSDSPRHNREPTQFRCKDTEIAPAHTACPGTGTHRDKDFKTANYSPQVFMALESLSALLPGTRFSGTEELRLIVNEN